MTNPAPVTGTNAVIKLLNRETETGRHPAVQYIHFDADKILFDYSNGYADIDRGMRWDKNTTFNGFSITKTFTALAILQLMEKGSLSLDDPAVRYLPANVLPGNVTIRHLLSHTSGLPNPLPLNWIHLHDEHAAFDRNQAFAPLMEKYSKMRLYPGTRFAYSNPGYLYLGQIIEKVTGMPYEKYILDHLVSKLHLKDDVLDFTTPYPLLHARGYHKRIGFSMLVLKMMIDTRKFMEPATGKWKPFRYYYVNGAPYGGLVGTAGGFAAYGRELLKDDCAIASPEMKKLLFTENLTAAKKHTGMALAWFTGKLRDHDYVAHAGGGGGYYCELRLYPSLKKGSFIVFNRTGFSDERYLDKPDIYMLR